MFAKRGVKTSADRVFGAGVGLTRTLAWLGIVSVAAVTATGCFGAPSSAHNATSSPDSDSHLTGFADCDDGLHRPPWECATLDVPLDREDPASGSITLTVFAIPHTDDSTPAGAPLFATPGGPGARGIDNYALWLLPAMVRAHHDVVSLDPRGTGTSATIECPGLANGAPTVEAYVAAVAACGEQLGAASDLYGGAQRAMDVEALRKKMDYEQIIFYGGSYGGVDVQAYAARYPERLAGLIIDGGFIVDDPDTFFGTPFPQDALAQVTAACSADAVCAASTDDPSGVLTRLLRTLATTPVKQGDQVVADEARVAVLIDQGLATDVIAAGIALERGNPAPLTELSAGLGAVGLPPDGSEDPTVYSAGANVAGWCNDGEVPWDVAASPETRTAQLDAALAAMPDDEFAPWSKAGWRAYSGVDQCLGWPAPSRRDPILTGTATIRGIPALLLVGAKDPGRALASALTTRFPDAPLIVVPDAGHPSLEAGQCIAEYAAEFVETLTVPAGTPCT
jgi:pimeloyl-ACP methyl ester carboxylesterase